MRWRIVFVFFVCLFVFLFFIFRFGEYVASFDIFFVMQFFFYLRTVSVISITTITVGKKSSRLLFEDLGSNT